MQPSPLPALPVSLTPAQLELSAWLLLSVVVIALLI